MTMRAMMSKPGDGPAFTDCDRIPGFVFDRPTEEYVGLWAVNEVTKVLAYVEAAFGLGAPVVTPWDCVGWSETMCDCNSGRRAPHTHMAGHGFMAAAYDDERKALVSALRAFVATSDDRETR